MNEHPDETRHPWECRDKGHEFLCRFGAGSCTRTGSSSCNAPDDDEAAALNKEASDG